MLAFIGNLSPLELVVIVVLAILIFGRNLPEVAGRVFYQLRRLRESFEDLRRETGIDREMRSIERSVRQAAWEAEARAAEVYDPKGDDEASDEGEPAASEENREEPPEMDDPAGSVARGEGSKD